MKIITLECRECGAITAGNVLENQRVMKCPAVNCENVLRFSDLDQTEQDHIMENIGDYRME